jgi:hypothetical protein
LKSRDGLKAVESDNDASRLQNGNHGGQERRVMSHEENDALSYERIFEGAVDSIETVKDLTSKAGGNIIQLSKSWFPPSSSNGRVMGVFADDAGELDDHILSGVDHAAS